jgi:hypothetical protein
MVAKRRKVKSWKILDAHFFALSRGRGGMTGAVILAYPFPSAAASNRVFCVDAPKGEMEILGIGPYQSADAIPQGLIQAVLSKEASTASGTEISTNQSFG